jgi:glycosyltransferase involved in cell wall biosynthesis
MKITVAIPTISGREEYLASSLDTCITQDFDEMEILVSDNSLNNDAKDLVEGYQDERIRYISPDKYLPMSAHWDFVVSHVSGDVFTIIGDDDGLMPDSIIRVEELYNEYGNKVIHHTLCNYKWPDFIEEGERNTIQFFHDVDNTETIIESAVVLKGLCKGTLRYVDGPMAYHNFAPTSIIRRAMKNNRFFNRASPDVYSSVALSAICENFLSVGECLTISGQGSLANGASAKQSGMVGANFLSEMKQCYKPRFDSRTIQLALLDSIFEVSVLYNRPDILNDINIPNHLMKAAFELKGIKGINNTLTEVSEIIKVAFQMHAFTPLLNLVLNDIVSRINFTKRNTTIQNQLPPKDKTIPLKKGLTIQCDESIKNIYQASIFLSETTKTAAIQEDAQFEQVG